mgnify:CR=1 FL=1|jgi:hypothetical protein
MSSTQPASTTELKEYCLRKLGKPVIDVNLADEQMNDMIEESVQFFQEYHFDGTEVYYAKEQVAPSTLTFASAASGTFDAEEIITGGTSGVTARIHEVTSTTVLKFKEHKNSDGLREANTSFTFTAGETITGSDSGATGTAHATQATAVVFGNIDTKALTADDTIIGIRDVLPIQAEKLSSDDMFSIEYQFNLNSLPGLLKGSGGLANYATSRQYISLMDDMFSKSDTRQIRFNRLTDKVYIDMDWDSAVKIGDWLVLQCYKKIDGSVYTELYNDIFLKKYTTALFKKQWGQNLIKYEGMQLPGGATLNGRQIYDDGNTELEKLEEESQMRYQLPDNFYVG